MRTGIACMSCLASTLIVFATFAVHAAPPSFQIARIYSNIDGTQQFIQLEETAGLNGQQHFAGLTLTITSVHGVAKQISFPDDLADDQTANEGVLIATGDVSYYGYVDDMGDTRSFPPDFVMPVRFIPTDGGTIDFAGGDQLSYPALPIDGWRAVDLSRDGIAVTATFRGFHRVPGADAYFSPAAVAQSGGVAIEYYNATLDHYFVTASAPDIDAIESGRTAGWAPTGQTFEVAGGVDIYYAEDPRSHNDHPQILDDPVCRFYIPPSEGDSHFYSASPGECDAVKTRFPEFVLESSAVFYAKLPDQVTGACPLSPYGVVPQNVPILVPWRAVFRLWNQRADSNHRFTTDPIIRNYMIQQGYLPEGYGPLGVAFCVGPVVF